MRVVTGWLTAQSKAFTNQALRLMRTYEHETCQSSDGPVRFYYDHWPTHGLGVDEHVFVGCPHNQLDPLPNDGRWTIESIHPLTVTPSIDFGPCGCHGWIRDGKWLIAAGGLG